MAVADKFTLRQVRIDSLVPQNNTAMVIPYGGTGLPSGKMEVSVVPMRCRLPQPGEVWLIDKQYGAWSFAALMVSPTLYKGGRDTGWLDLPTDWLTAADPASLTGTIRRIEDRVTLRIRITGAAVGTYTGTTSAPLGWSAGPGGSIFPLLSAAGSVGTLTVPAAGSTDAFTAQVATAGDIATNEYSWLCDDNFPSILQMQAAPGA